MIKAIVAAAAIVAFVACGEAPPAASVPASPDKSPVVTAAKPSPQGPVVLLDVSGNGSKTTQSFTAKGNFDFAWTYDCSGFGFQGNFIADLYTSDNSPSFDNSGVNQLGMKDSGVEHYHAGGTFYVKVISECSWTIKATG